MVHPANFLKIRKAYVVNNLPIKTSVYFWDLVELKKVEKELSLTSRKTWQRKGRG